MLTVEVDSYTYIYLSSYQRTWRQVPFVHLTCFTGRLSSIVIQAEILTAAKNLAAAGVLERCKRKKKNVPVLPPEPGPRVTRSTTRQQAAQATATKSRYSVTVEEVEDKDALPRSDGEVEMEPLVYDDKAIEMNHLFSDSEYKCTCGRKGKQCKCCLGAAHFGVWNQAGHPVSTSTHVYLSYSTYSHPLRRSMQPVHLAQLATSYATRQ